MCLHPFCPSGMCVLTVVRVYIFFYSIPHIFFIHYYAALSQAPHRPPLVVAAGQGQLATVQQLIEDGVGTLEDQDEVPTN